LPIFIQIAPLSTRDIVLHEIGVDRQRTTDGQTAERTTRKHDAFRLLLLAEA